MARTVIIKVPVAVAWSDDNFDLIVRGMMRKPTDDIYSFSSFLGLVTEHWPRAPSHSYNDALFINSSYKDIPHEKEKKTGKGLSRRNIENNNRIENQGEAY